MRTSQETCHSFIGYFRSKILQLTQTYTNLMLAFDMHAKCHFVYSYESNFTGHYSVGRYLVNSFTFDLFSFRSFFRRSVNFYLLFVLNAAFPCRSHLVELVAKFWFESNQWKKRHVSWEVCTTTFQLPIGSFIKKCWFFGSELVLWLARNHWVTLLS